MPTRIWHQSMTDLERLPGYKTMLAEHALRVGNGLLQVDLHGVLPETYPPGVAPVALTKYRWAHHLVFDQFVENAVRAEIEGYDAVAISCFVDPGLELARSAVDIPVVSSCETALLVSAAIGHSFGLITIDPAMVRIVGELVSKYGFANRVRFIESLDPPMDEFVLDQAFQGIGPLVPSFSAQARRLIAQHDVDVVIPAEGVLNTMLVRNGIREIDGVPILDSYGALLQMAEMMVRLRHTTGLGPSRRLCYAKPPPDLMSPLRRLTAGVLERGARPAGIPRD